MFSFEIVEAICAAYLIKDKTKKFTGIQRSWPFRMQAEVARARTCIRRQSSLPFAYHLSFVSTFNLFQIDMSSKRKFNASDSENEDSDNLQVATSRLSESESEKSAGSAESSSASESESELEKKIEKLKKKKLKASLRKEKKEFQNLTLRELDRRIRTAVREEIHRMGITRTIPNNHSADSDTYCSYCKLRNHTKENCRKLLNKRPRL
jgi:hypothetical protein